MLKKMKFLYLAAFLFTPILSRDVLFEFKAGAWLSPLSVDEILGVFGSEITFRLNENTNWHGFANISLVTTNLRKNNTDCFALPFIFGAKYLMPSRFGNLYFGVGAALPLPYYLIPLPVIKLGNILPLSDNCFVDLFLDVPAPFVYGIVGLGLGYRF